MFDGVFLGPARGDGINKWDTAENNTTIIHTVTVDKIFYLYAVTFHAHNVGAAANSGRLLVRNGGDVEQYRIYCVCCMANESVLGSLSWTSPVRIPAGWDIVVISDAASLNVCAYISGYEVSFP